MQIQIWDLDLIKLRKNEFWITKSPWIMMINGHTQQQHLSERLALTENATEYESVSYRWQCSMHEIRTKEESLNFASQFLIRKEQGMADGMAASSPVSIIPSSSYGNRQRPRIYDTCPCPRSNERTTGAISQNISTRSYMLDTAPQK